MNDYGYEDICVGHIEKFYICVNEMLGECFHELTGDENPLHRNREFAIKNGFKDKVVYGMLISSFLSTLAGVYLPGKNSLIHSVEIKFNNPVYYDDKLEIIGEVIEKNDTFHLLVIAVSIFNQDHLKVYKAKMKVGVLDE